VLLCSYFRRVLGFIFEKRVLHSAAPPRAIALAPKSPGPLEKKEH